MKKVKIKHLLNIDHTSHFVNTLFFFAMPTCFLYCSWLLCFFLWGFVLFVQVRIDKSFILYFPTKLFQCELMTVSVIVAGRSLLVVMC